MQTKIEYKESDTLFNNCDELVRDGLRVKEFLKCDALIGPPDVDGQTGQYPTQALITPRELTEASIFLFHPPSSQARSNHHPPLVTEAALNNV